MVRQRCLESEMRAVTTEEDWLIDLLGGWQLVGKKFGPEELAREITSHLVLSPLRRGQDGSPLLPTEEDAFAEMETRLQIEGPA